MAVAPFLTIAGGIILLGVFGTYFFNRTKIPVPVVLMLIGILLGPLTGAFQSSTFVRVAPIFGTVALILILFEGGLDLDFELVLSQFSPAFVLGLSYFSFCVVVCSAIMAIIIGLPWPTAFLGGLIIGGASPTVVMPVLARLTLAKEMKTLLSIESVISEILTVVCVLLYLDAVRNPSVAPVATILHLVQGIGLSIVLAAVVGLIWSRVIPVLVKEQMSYMLTLGVVFLLYALSSGLGAEPAITVLFFGIFLGNAGWLVRKLAPLFGSKAQEVFKDTQTEVHEVLKTIYAELSFLVRTFFFVFMGLIFEFHGISIRVWIGLALLLGAILGLRFLAVSWVFRFFAKLNRNVQTASTAMLPRGLACAVVALIAAHSHLPLAPELLPIALLVILGSNLIMTALVFRHEGNAISENPPAPIIES